MAAKKTSTRSRVKKKPEVTALPQRVILNIDQYEALRSAAAPPASLLESSRASENGKIQVAPSRAQTVAEDVRDNAERRTKQAIALLERINTLRDKLGVGDPPQPASANGVSVSCRSGILGDIERHLHELAQILGAIGSGMDSVEGCI